MIRKKIFNWVFKEQLNELNIIKSDLKFQIKNACDIHSVLIKQKEVFDQVLSGIDVSIDVHEYDNKYSPSWAVVCIQGQRSDFIKFINLGTRDIQQISSFLHQYDKVNNIKVDASPSCSEFLKVSNSYRY